MGLRDRIAALLGVSAYAPPPANTPSLDSREVKRAREVHGGQLAPMPASQTRWYLDDLEAAVHAADSGWLGQAARLMRDARSDGKFAGVLSTRTGGLVRLPKRFRGDAEMIAALEVGHEHARSVFDEMFPATELALLAADGVLLGVGVAELCEVQGRDYPVMVRRDPEFLVYRWNEARWYFRSIIGLIPITPGDGRWILHTPGGREAPWQNGLWRAIGNAYIRKSHAREHKANWEAKLANPARVATAPAGATDSQLDEWVQQVMAWGINTVFGMRPGYDAKLLESNGRGHESFDKTIDDADEEMTVAIAGQTVTTDGGAGFQNSDIHKSIRADLIKETSDGLAYTINTQGIPPFVHARWGEDALDRSPVVEWDVTPAKDRNSEATALVSVANAMKGLDEALAKHGKKIDVEAMCTQFGLRTTAATADEIAAALANASKPKLELVRGGA
ncbi:phage portal protein family protein [Sandaracinus amylolyticus]|uniref:Mu-like prophage FluMu protein gp29 n=1 Tax=Sandaracinus amylolyticus TaxID=927083 RepID=A0A0F6YHV7_9BACT|nr:DUF935 family protein [Sandaracinus amylolyticus]AKF06070.1 Mu-like prophage FluMu protein gp29 [Sandaracinus amylolyticus]